MFSTAPGGNVAHAYSTTYAAIGRPDGVSRTQDDYAEDYLYDALGRPVETTATYEVRDYAYSTTYDTAGRPATLTYPAALDGQTPAEAYRAGQPVDVINRILAA